MSEFINNNNFLTKIANCGIQQLDGRGKYCSYNVNSDRRTEPNGSHSRVFGFLGFDNRALGICMELFVLNCDIYSLQELDDNSLGIIRTFLQHIGYDVYAKKYDENKSAFWLLIAWKRSEYTLINNTIRYYKYGDTSEHVSRPDNYNSLSVEEKNMYSGQIFSFTAKNGTTIYEEYHKAIIFVQLRNTSGREFIFGCTHFGLRIEYKMFSADLLSSILESIMIEFRCGTDCPLIIGGDFNTFMDERGLEQIDRIKEKTGCSELVGSNFFNPYATADDDMFSTNDATSTFNFFAHDTGTINFLGKEMNDKLMNSCKNSEIEPTEVIEEFKNALKGKRENPLGNSILDHIFFRGINLDHQYVVVPLEGRSAKMFDNVDELTEYFNEHNKRFIAPFPSDHFAVIANFF